MPPRSAAEVAFAASVVLPPPPADDEPLEDIAPDDIAPEVIAPEVIASEDIAPDDMAPDVIALEFIAPDVVAPEVMAALDELEATELLPEVSEEPAAGVLELPHALAVRASAASPAMKPVRLNAERLETSRTSSSSRTMGTYGA